MTFTDTQIQDQLQTVARDNLAGSTCNLTHYHTGRIVIRLNSTGEAVHEGWSETEAQKFINDSGVLITSTHTNAGAILAALKAVQS